MKTTSTYWEGNGTHQSLYAELIKLIPAMGEVEDKHRHAALETLRKACNAYYDIFNNGGMNRAAQIRATFGISVKSYRNSWTMSTDWEAIHAVVEPVMDRLILAATEEQQRNLQTAGRKVLLSRAEKKRRDEIIGQLVELARNGWANARPCDYEPLEKELRKIEGRM
jgi:hypothetical protein